jgi:hypothetical protein
MILTLLPIEWTRQTASVNLPPEAIAYAIAGLPEQRGVVISLAPGGWRVVHEFFKAAMDREARYPTPEQALAALRAFIDLKTEV